MRCLYCDSEATVKNGHVKGLQRYKCKECGYQFTKETCRHSSFLDRVLALTLYLSGLPRSMASQLVGISAKSVAWWSTRYRKANPLYELRGRGIVQEIGLVQEVATDEILQCLNKKSMFSETGKLLVITPGGLAADNVVIVVRKPPPASARDHY